MTVEPAGPLDAVRAWLDGRRPRAALILGSGLGGVTGRLREVTRLEFERIPGFPLPGPAGHAGELVAGLLGGRQILCQSGRFHGYEGHPPSTVARPSRLFGALGIETVIVTNAAGGIRRTFSPGHIVCLADQINLTWSNPLVGALAPGEQRFPDMSAPYDGELIALAHRVARAGGLALEDGVYAGVAGPSYETAAEVRMLERCGADLVGMSTIAEVIVLRAQGIRCLGLSLVTNRAAGLGPGALSHAEVLVAAAAAGERLGRLLEGVIAGLD